MEAAQQHLSAALLTPSQWRRGGVEAKADGRRVSAAAMLARRGVSWGAVQSALQHHLALEGEELGEHDDKKDDGTIAAAVACMLSLPQHVRHTVQANCVYRPIQEQAGGSSMWDSCMHAVFSASLCLLCSRTSFMVMERTQAAQRARYLKEEHMHIPDDLQFEEVRS